eukprot:524215-Amorphochlora_amoeboformis.AAC.1
MYLALAFLIVFLSNLKFDSEEKGRFHRFWREGSCGGRCRTRKLRGGGGGGGSEVAGGKMDKEWEFILRRCRLRSISSGLGLGLGQGRGEGRVKWTRVVIIVGQFL